MIFMSFNSTLRFSRFVLFSGMLLLALAGEIKAQQSTSTSQPARLIVLVETEPYHSFLGDAYGQSYYQTPEVECWLDNDVKLYAGPVHKPGKITRIYDGHVESGEHYLKIRWQAKLRIIESYKWDRKDGQKVVTVPDEGFETIYLKLAPNETKVIKATVRRTADLKKLLNELIVEDITEQITIQ